MAKEKGSAGSAKKTPAPGGQGSLPGSAGERLHELLVKQDPKSTASDRVRAELRRILADGMTLLTKCGGKRLRGTGETKLDHSGLVFDYESWFTAALPVVRQVVPERLQEFTELYRSTKRKTVSAETYRISDYLAGLTVTLRDGFEEIPLDIDAAFQGCFMRQLAILRSCSARLDLLLQDLRGVVEAEVFRDELASAEGLLAKGHRRGSGALAGVVLERHLQHVAGLHGVALAGRQATLGDWNEALRKSGVYDIATWRRIQALADIRNLCAHSKDREPSEVEVQDLISGVRGVMSSVQ